MKVKATLTPKNGGAVVLTIDWDIRDAVRMFADVANVCLRSGGTVLTEPLKD